MNQLYLSEMVPKYTNVGSNIYSVESYNLSNKYIILKYETKNRHKNSKLCYQSKIPIKIPLNKEVLRVLGLLEAEMSKTKKSNNIIFSNSEPIAINSIMLFFNKYFQVGFNAWGQLVEFNRHLVNYENPSQTKIREYVSRLFWIKNTKILSYRFFRKWCIYRGQEHISKLNTKNEWGMLSIQYGNKLLLNVILNILDYINRNLEFLSKKQIYYYLDGLFSGDGGIFYKDYERFIYLTSYDYHFVMKINSLLRNKLEMKSYIINNKVVVISNLKDLYEFYKQGLFNLNVDKRYKLLIALMSYKQLQGRSKVIEKDFNNSKNLFKRDLDLLKYSLRKRRMNFYKFYGLAKERINNTSFNFEIEIKLTGLLRKPTIFEVSNVICGSKGITIKGIKERTMLSLSSIYHATNRLLKSEYIIQNKYNCPNLKIFPTGKLIRDTKIANKLQSKFDSRYGCL